MGLGELITQKRKEKGLSQSAVAELTGLPRTTISELELDLIKHPAADTLAILSQKLSIPFRDALKEIGIELPIQPVKESIIEELESLEVKMSGDLERLRDAINRLKQI